MRDYIIACIIILGTLPFIASGQVTQMTIVPKNGTDICFGYTSQNVAIVEMVSELPPFTSNNQIFVTYTWRAEHANGSRIWNTSRNARVIPISFTGEHKITCDVEFVVLGSSTPFQVISSNTLTINGKVCANKTIAQPDKLNSYELRSVIKNN